MNIDKDLLYKAYQSGIEDGVNRCGYNTTVMQMIKSEKRQEFMKEYPQPQFKNKEELFKYLEL